MPIYTYRVKNESGKIFTGETKIESESDLISLLLERGYTPVEIKEKNAFNDISQISIFQKKVKIRDLAVFCRQFAIVLEAGVPMAAALDVLREQTKNPTFKACINDVYENIQKGMSLSSSMKRHEGTFPELLINMVESGEISGQLDRVFSRMAEQFEKDYKMNHKIKNAMTYPMIVTSVAVLVVIVLMSFVVPQFTKVLSDMKVDLPLMTKILIAVSTFFKKLWWLIFGGLIILVIFLRNYFSSNDGKRFLSSLAIKIPVISNLTRNIMTARLTRTLGTLIASGVLLIQAMEIVKKVLGNVLVSDMIGDVIEEIKRGKGLTQPLHNLKYFPPMLISMVRIGEESGDLDLTLDKCADFYDQEVETSLQQLTALLEPAIIIFLAVVVGFIILSVLYPMFSIYENIG